MNFVTDKLAEVVAAMRPIDSSYGQAMLDYMAEFHPETDLEEAPFFMFGHRREINARLLEMDKDRVYQYQKYPLIALRMDFPEEVSGIDISYTLNVAILAFTQRDFRAPERMERVFKPVLAPLYERFMQEIRNSGFFMWPVTLDQNKPPHTRILRPFFGTEGSEGTEKQIFTDPLDAIELLNLQLNLKEKTC